MTEERLGFPREELRARTARGAVVNALFLGGAEALVLLQGLIVTVLLGPSDIGLYGIVTTTAMTVAALRRVGIDEAFVQQSEEDQEEEFQRAFTLELGVGLAFSALLVAAAPLVAVAYGEDELLALMLAVAYLPTSFALLAPAWIFFRRMDFLRVRVIHVLVPVVTFCVTVPLAASGVGVWSLVTGPAAGNAVGVAAALWLSPYRVRVRYEPAARDRYLRFSWPVFASAVALLVVQQGQIFAFDRHGGLAAAGFITLAVTLTRYADRADHIIATTIYPAICEVRERIPTLEEIFEKSNRVALMWVLPFCAGFVLFAPDLVEFVLGDAWEPAVILLQGLAGAAALQQLGYNWFSFYRARGEPAVQAVEAAVTAGGFLALALPGLARWGLEGFVAGRIAGAALVVGARIVYVRRLLPGVDLLRIAVRGAAPVLAAAGLVLLARLVPWADERTLAQALAELALFAGVTALLTWLSERPLLRELLEQVRARGSEAGPARAPA